MKMKIMLPLTIVAMTMTMSACLFTSDDNETNHSSSPNLKIGPEPISFSEPSDNQSTYEIINKSQIEISEIDYPHCSQGKAVRRKLTTTYDYLINNNQLFLVEAEEPDENCSSCKLYEGKGNNLESTEWTQVAYSGLERLNHRAPKPSDCVEREVFGSIQVATIDRFEGGDVSSSIEVTHYCAAEFFSEIYSREAGYFIQGLGGKISATDCRTMEVKLNGKTSQIIVEDFSDGRPKLNFVFKNGSCVLADPMPSTTNENCSSALPNLTQDQNPDRYYMDDVDTKANLEWQDCLKDLGHADYIRLHSNQR